MNIKLVRATVDDAELIWKMQIDAFAELLEKYQDYDTNPGNEPIEKVIMRLKEPFTYYYLMFVNEDIVGAIRVVDKKENSVNKRISPIISILREKIGIAEKEVIHV